MMKAVANAAYTTTATAGVANTVTDANKRIDASNARITTVETRSSNTCSKVVNRSKIHSSSILFSTVKMYTFVEFYSRFCSIY